MFFGVFPKRSNKEVPYTLPVGLVEFSEFADRIISKAGEFADRESLIYAIAMELIHSDPKTQFTDEFFVTRLRKVAANQVASQVIQDIKAKQQRARDEAAAEKAKLVEVTTSETTTDAKGQEQKN